MTDTNDIKAGIGWAVRPDGAAPAAARRHSGFVTDGVNGEVGGLISVGGGVAVGELSKAAVAWHEDSTVSTFCTYCFK